MWQLGAYLQKKADAIIEASMGIFASIIAGSNTWLLWENLKEVFGLPIPSSDEEEVVTIPHPAPLKWGWSKKKRAQCLLTAKNIHPNDPENLTMTSLVPYEVPEWSKINTHGDTNAAPADLKDKTTIPFVYTSTENTKTWLSNVCTAKPECGNQRLEKPYETMTRGTGCKQGCIAISPSHGHWCYHLSVNLTTVLSFHQDAFNPMLVNFLGHMWMKQDWVYVAI